MTRAIGVGAGGHAKGLIEIARTIDAAELVGLVDANRALHGTVVGGVIVLGGDELLPGFHGSGVRNAFIGIGSVGDATVRARVFEAVRRIGFSPMTLVHSSAVVSTSAALGVGVAVMAGAIVNAGATIGDNVIVNTGAIVEHDCDVAAHAHIATGARLAGGVRVGEGAHVGIGAVIKEGLRIGARAVVGAGAVVVEDVRDGAVVAGNPARERRP